MKSILAFNKETWKGKQTENQDSIKRPTDHDPFREV